MLVKTVWVVNYFFNRGNVQTLEFDNIKDAKNDVNTVVFNNQDCVNVSIFRKEVTADKYEAF